MNKLQNKNTSNGVKNALLITVSLFLFLTIAISVNAATIIEDYPNLPACENNTQCHPGQAGFGLPQFIKYIYLFALGIVGIVGLLAIIFAAFGYVTSAGNPQKASNAKDKIISALLGLLLLLGSVVLLNLINPDLLKLKMEEAEPVTVNIPPTDGGCQYKTATLTPTTLNGGESMVLTLTRQNCPNPDSHRVMIEIKQTKGAGTTLYSEVVKNAVVIKKTDTEWAVKFTFVAVVNMIKDAPEEPYLEGWIEIPNQSKQYIPRINILLRDLKNDGTCCK